MRTFETAQHRTDTGSLLLLPLLQRAVTYYCKCSCHKNHLPPPFLSLPTYHLSHYITLLPIRSHYITVDEVHSASELIHTYYFLISAFDIHMILLRKIIVLLIQNTFLNQYYIKLIITFDRNSFKLLGSPNSYRL